MVKRCAGRALASDTVAGLQDKDPRLRGQLPGSWRLLKTWAVNEIPNRAPPLPVHVLHALVGWAFFHQHITFGVSLLIGFYGMLRTGEILGLSSHHVAGNQSASKYVISFGLTKSGKRQGAAESVVIGYDLVVEFLRKWKALARPHTCFGPSPTRWRKLFSEGLSALKLEPFGFRPYSLRRGGAPSLPSLAPFLHVFQQSQLRNSFAALEPPSVVPEGRPGGRGKAKKAKAMKRQKIFFRKVKVHEFHPWFPE